MNSSNNNRPTTANLPPLPTIWTVDQLAAELGLTPRQVRYRAKKMRLIATWVLGKATAKAAYPLQPFLTCNIPTLRRTPHASR